MLIGSDWIVDDLTVREAGYISEREIQLNKRRVAYDFFFGDSIEHNSFFSRILFFLQIINNNLLGGIHLRNENQLCLPNVNVNVR